MIDKDFLIVGIFFGLASGITPGPLLTLVISETLIQITIPRSSAAVGTGQSSIFKRGYPYYIDGRIKACKPLCV